MVVIIIIVGGIDLWFGLLVDEIRRRSSGTTTAGTGRWCGAVLLVETEHACCGILLVVGGIYVRVCFELRVVDCWLQSLLDPMYCLCDG